ncbi:hypothetical protein JCM17823_00690 [Halorubrum gandharaense]
MGASPPSGPRNPPDGDGSAAPDPTEPDDGSPAFRLGDWDFGSDDDGDLRVETNVINEAPSERSGTVVVAVTVGDERHEERADVAVPAEEVETVPLHFEVSYEAFDAGGSLTVDLERD